MTEYQRMLYADLGSRIRWHFQENDLTLIEVIVILDMIKGECLDAAFMEMGGEDFEFEEEDDDQEGWKQS